MTTPSRKFAVHLARLSLLWLASVVGCGTSPSTPQVDNPQWHPSPFVPSRFDPEKSITVEGFVIWVGPLPQASSIEGLLKIGSEYQPRSFQNPNRVRLNTNSARVEGAVVFLEDVDPSESCPWFHQPVQVLVNDEGIRTSKETSATPLRVGFVKEGSVVEFIAEDHGSHVLSLRGSEFFGMPLPEVGVPRRHRLNKPGLVEISSAAFRPWHRAYLWVMSHPYIAITNDQGEFFFRQVPPGNYQFRVWHPNSEILSYERDPNTGMVTRIRFAPPLTSSRYVRVQSGMDRVVLMLSK